MGKIIECIIIGLLSGTIITKLGFTIFMWQTWILGLLLSLSISYVYNFIKNKYY